MEPAGRPPAIAACFRSSADAPAAKKPERSGEPLWRQAPGAGGAPGQLGAARGPPHPPAAPAAQQPSVPELQALLARSPALWAALTQLDRDEHGRISGASLERIRDALDAGAPSAAQVAAAAAARVAATRRDAAAAIRAAPPEPGAPAAAAPPGALARCQPGGVGPPGAGDLARQPLAQRAAAAEQAAAAAGAAAEAAAEAAASAAAAAPSPVGAASPVAVALSPAGSSSPGSRRNSLRLSLSVDVSAPSERGGSRPGGGGARTRSSADSPDSGGLGGERASDGAADTDGSCSDGGAAGGAAVQACSPVQRVEQAGQDAAPGGARHRPAWGRKLSGRPSTPGVSLGKPVSIFSGPTGAAAAGGAGARQRRQRPPSSQEQGDESERAAERAQQQDRQQLARGHQASKRPPTPGVSLGKPVSIFSGSGGGGAAAGGASGVDADSSSDDDDNDDGGHAIQFGAARPARGGQRRGPARPPPAARGGVEPGAARQQPRWQHKLSRRPPTPGAGLGRPVSIFHGGPADRAGGGAPAGVRPCSAPAVAGWRGGGGTAAAAAAGVSFASADGGGGSRCRAGDSNGCDGRVRFSEPGARVRWKPALLHHSDEPRPLAPPAQPPLPARQGAQAWGRKLSLRPPTPGSGLGEPVSIFGGSRHGEEDDGSGGSGGDASPAACGRQPAVSPRSRIPRAPAAAPQPSRPGGGHSQPREQRRVSFEERQPSQRPATPGVGLKQPLSIFGGSTDGRAGAPCASKPATPAAGLGRQPGLQFRLTESEDEAEAGAAAAWPRAAPQPLAAPSAAAAQPARAAQPAVAAPRALGSNPDLASVFRDEPGEGAAPAGAAARQPAARPGSAASASSGGGGGGALPAAGAVQQELLRHSPELALERQAQWERAQARRPPTPGVGLAMATAGSTFREPEQGPAPRQRPAAAAAAARSGDAAASPPAELREALLRHNGDLAAERETGWAAKLSRRPPTPGAGLAHSMFWDDSAEHSERGASTAAPAAAAATAAPAPRPASAAAGGAPASAAAPQQSVQQALLRHSPELALERQAQWERAQARRPPTPGVGLQLAVNIFREQPDPARADDRAATSPGRAAPASPRAASPDPMAGPARRRSGEGGAAPASPSGGRLGSANPARARRRSSSPLHNVTSAQEAEAGARAGSPRAGSPLQRSTSPADPDPRGGAPWATTLRPAGGAAPKPVQELHELALRLICASHQAKQQAVAAAMQQRVRAGAGGAAVARPPAAAAARPLCAGAGRLCCSAAAPGWRRGGRGPAAAAGGVAAQRAPHQPRAAHHHQPAPPCLDPAACNPWRPARGHGHGRAGCRSVAAAAAAGGGAWAAAQLPGALGPPPPPPAPPHQQRQQQQQQQQQQHGRRGGAARRRPLLRPAGAARPRAVRARAAAALALADPGAAAAAAGGALAAGGAALGAGGALGGGAAQLLAVALGYAVMAGSLFRSVPQIAKVLRHRSTEGLSLASVLVELGCYSITIAYNLSQGYVFNTFGEVCACWAQDIVLIALIFRFSGTRPWVVAATAAAAAAACAWLLSPACPPRLLAGLQASNIATLALGSRLPQIVLNLRRGNAGVLSVTTCLLNVAGNAARVFTTVVLTGDLLILAGYLSQGSLNAVLLAQSVGTARQRRAAAAAAAAAAGADGGGAPAAPPRGGAAAAKQQQQQQQSAAAELGVAAAHPPGPPDAAGGLVVAPA
ncbi:Mpdu1 [Scenedesmus sp. PABB004]|nr:Mpdu1 [Scenedesmus sp. PABB004]